MNIKFVPINSVTICFTLFIIVLLVQGELFLTGYRLSADDILFHHLLMKGWAGAWTHVKNTSIDQGRIVHFLDLPFTLLGAYYAGSYIFRIFYTVLYFANFVLIGAYASLVLFSRYVFSSVLLISLLLISFHPLDYFHLAPNAYPLHVSIPIFFILVARIKLWVLRSYVCSRFRVREVIWLLLFFIGMMFGEYGFLFGFSIVISEMFIRIARMSYTKNMFFNNIMGWFRCRYFLKDLAVMIVFLVLYFGFRIIFPSNYDGNQLTLDFNRPFFKTLYGHIYGGTSIASFVRYGFSYMGSIGLVNWFFGFIIFIGTFLIANFCVKDVVIKARELPIFRFLIMAVLCFICAIVVTAPVALTMKYQDWCSNIDTCIYLDSRISYLAVGGFIFALLVSIIKMAHRLKIGSITSAIVNLILAVVASCTYLNNKHIEIEMKGYVSAWERCKKIACMPETVLKGVKISSIVDPLRLVRYHSSDIVDINIFDINDYWSRNLESQKLKCIHRYVRNVRPVPSDLFPELFLGSPMFAGKFGSALPFLGSGWSCPETWGVWSDASVAEIYIPFSHDIKEVIIEAKAFVIPANPKQTIIVKVNGANVANLLISDSKNNLIKITITDKIKRSIVQGGLLYIQFVLPTAVSPKQLGLSADSRKLSIGLISMLIS